MAPKAKTVSVPWLDTSIDIQKVFTLSDDRTQILLGGKPLTDQQIVTLKSEAEVIERMHLWPLLVETVRQQAIATGFNKAENFEALVASKSVLFVTDWMKTWTTAIRSVKMKSVQDSSTKT